MRYFLLIFAFLCLQYSCKKSDVQSNLTDKDPDCVTQKTAADGDTIEGQYIVAYAAASKARRMSVNELSRLSETVLQRHAIKATSLLHSFGGEPGGFIVKLSKDELSRLSSDATISMIEPDRMIALGNCFTIVEPRLITWNINRVGYGNGIGKVAWVIDTGIDFDHPDLTIDATRSRSFIDGQNSAKDENGHGTHVAGIIAAKNNTIGVLGVASGATLISLRVLNKEGKGAVSSIIQALAYISVNAKAGDAVNMSLGEDGISEILDQQVRNTAAKGILISIAAGNDHKPADQYSPARVNGENIYTVSAIDSVGNFAGFSNYGNDVVDYAAPGVRILSTYMNSKYAIMSGTSMAAPHLTGLLLLNGNNITTSGTAINDPDGVSDEIAHN